MNSTINTGVSRRSFMRILGAASAAATSFPAFAAIQQGAPAVAPQSGRRGMGGMSDMGDMHQLPTDTVIISSNENPLGPAQSALTAICTTASLGGRYHFDETMKKVAQLSGGNSYNAATLQELKAVYSSLQQQIGYETIKGDASVGWLRLGALVLALAGLAALLINRRLPT